MSRTLAPIRTVSQATPTWPMHFPAREPPYPFYVLWTEYEGWISGIRAPFCSKYCNAHNILGDISEFKRGQIIGACLVGTSVNKTASLCDVSRAMMSSVGRTTSNRMNCGRKRKLCERDIWVLTWQNKWMAKAVEMKSKMSTLLWTHILQFIERRDPFLLA